MLAELRARMVWLQLLRAGAVALRPAHVLMGLLALVLIGVWGALVDGVGAWASTKVSWLSWRGVGPATALAENVEGALRRTGAAVLDLDAPAALVGLRDLVMGPLDVLMQQPWKALAVLVPALIVWGLFGGAIARSAAVMFATGERMKMSRALAFAAAKVWGFFFVVVAPFVVAAMIAAVLAGLGWVFFRFAASGFAGGYVGGAVSVIGGALYVVALALSGVAVVVLVGALAGAPMVVPALASEGTDAIDAFQRVLAYVWARPFRVLLYVLVLTVQAALIAGLIGLTVGWIGSFAANATTVLIDGGPAAEVARAVKTQTLEGRMPGYSAPTGLAAAGVRAVGFWSKVLGLAVPSFLVSFWFAAGAVLYLCVRRVVDGQDVGELWGGVGAKRAEVAGGDTEEE